MTELHKRTLLAFGVGTIFGWFLVAFVFYPPHPGWGIKAHWGDIATWFAGTGSFAAVVAALRIAGTDRRERRRQKDELASTAAHYIYTDIQRLLIDSKVLFECLHALADVPNGMGYMAEMQQVTMCTGEIKAIVQRASLEQISVLPASVGGRLAGTMGGYQLILESIESTIRALGYNMPLDNYRKELRDHGEAMKPLLRTLKPFFLWFGQESKEHLETVATPSLRIIDDIVGSE